MAYQSVAPSIFNQQLFMALVLFVVALISLCRLSDATTNLEYTEHLFPDSQFIDLISRDSEAFPGSLLSGHKYITGGAGEGDQQLRPEDTFEHREQVKSDNVLPAYCEPPNPCPVGFSAENDGCLEEFDNSAEFSRNYQAQQQCLCDQEHMFNCLTKNTDEYEEGLEEMLSKNGLHKNMIAKKFHETRLDEPRRRKRDTSDSQYTYYHYNPYLSGEPLRSVAKKDGRRTVM